MYHITKVIAWPFSTRTNHVSFSMLPNCLIMVLRWSAYYMLTVRNTWNHCTFQWRLYVLFCSLASHSRLYLSFTHWQINMHDDWSVATDSLANARCEGRVICYAGGQYIFCMNHCIVAWRVTDLDCYLYKKTIVIYSVLVVALLEFWNLSHLR